uniref:Ankyrin repeat-containing protein At3g12360 n=1 Tax=Anthurium amnicola TaxID=1678845 RepID=A0A1D1Y6R9_9ARAE
MDRRLHSASLSGDVIAFLELVRDDEQVLTQATLPSLDTALHLAAKYGHAGLVSEILWLEPRLASAENARMEAPVHEACREGHATVVELLVEIDPWVAYKPNGDNQSALAVACSCGHLDVVKYLLGRPWQMASEEDGTPTSLHAAASGGHTDVVRELLKVRRDFAWKKDAHGRTALHLASSKGHLEITREFLRVDPDLCLAQDGDGRTPLHWAVIRGRVAVIAEIISVSLDSVQVLTKGGESALHLGAKFNQYEGVRYLVEALDVTDLIDLPDHGGNTVLHLAAAAKLHSMVTYLVNQSSVEVNALNSNGYTALDVVARDVGSSGSLQIVSTLLGAGGKLSKELPPTSSDTRRLVVEVPNGGSPPRQPRGIAPSPSSPSRKKNDAALDSSMSSYRRHRRQVKREKTQREHQTEGLRNARNTITVVAVLIASVTFAAGINPPGCSDQNGTKVVGRSTAFKVFTVSNTVALFSSLSIVFVLVSIIPFRRRPMMRLLMVTHKAMWASISFMAVAYVAGTWMVLPRSRGTRWVVATLLAVAAGSVGSVFVGLGVMLAGHLVRKWEWRRARVKRKEKVNPSSSISRVKEVMRVNRRRRTSSASSNSDLASSEISGYHTY